MKLGQYEIIERIATGGMAEVYRGRAVGEEGFEKPVAIKRILPHYASDARFVSMLVQEARIHAGLSHRNIVQIHDLGQSDGDEYFIVLEFVDGRDLGALLEVMSKAAPPGNRSGDALSLYIAIELAEGVHFSHESVGPDGTPLGLIHRDISPSNVLISYAGEVKLSDFGLAKRQSDHSVVGSLKGKLAYMSPEQARRVPLDRRSDIFSLGAVLFELVTGKRLRPAMDESEGLRMLASGVVTSPRSARADIPPVIEELLLRCLAPDPENRFPDAAAFITEARAALDQVPRARSGEAAELQQLLRTFIPPGAPRPATEPSRVIRLHSEFLPRGKALALTPPFPIVPGREAWPDAEPPLEKQKRHPTLQGAPPVPQVPLIAVPARNARWAVGAPLAQPERPASDPRGEAVTPPVVSVSGELRSFEPPRDRRPPTPPPPPRALTPPPPRALTPPPPAPSSPERAPVAAENGLDDGPLSRRRRPSLPGMPEPRAHTPAPAPAVSQSHELRPSAAAAVSSASPVGRFTGGNFPIELNLEPVPLPPGPARGAPASSPASSVAYFSPQPEAVFSPPVALNDGGLSTPRLAPQEPFRPPTRSSGSRTGAFLGLLLLLGAGAAVAHVMVAPLPILIRWWQPARLSVDSDPSGATISLDGVRLPGQTPLQVDIRRDQRSHLLVVAKEGYQERQIPIRYDRQESLSERVTLLTDSKPNVQQIPADPRPAPAADAGVALPGSVAPGVAAPALMAQVPVARASGSASAAKAQKLKVARSRKAALQKRKRARR